MIRSLLFLGLQNSVLDLPLNRLAAILHLHLSGGVQGWVYGAEMLLLFLTLFFFFFLTEESAFPLSPLHPERFRRTRQSSAVLN